MIRECFSQARGRSGRINDRFRERALAGHREPYDFRFANRSIRGSLRSTHDQIADAASLKFSRALDDREHIGSDARFYTSRAG
jgi:hypothetical protein